MIGATTTDLPQAVRAFRPHCPGCSIEVITKPGARPCSTFDCPGLPPELEVTCDLCLYDFFADDGQPRCDHETCETAIRLRANVPIFRQWLRLISSEI